MRVLRRLTASLLAASLLLAGPRGLPKTCLECPPGCPMHAQQGGHGRAEGQPGCHRSTKPVPAGTVCLRSHCGHDATAESPTTLLSVLTPAVSVSPPVPGPRVAPPAVRVASLDAPEPPLRPPRLARG